SFGPAPHQCRPETLRSVIKSTGTATACSVTAVAFVAAFQVTFKLFGNLFPGSLRQLFRITRLFLLLNLSIHIRVYSNLLLYNTFIIIIIIGNHFITVMYILL